MKCPHCNKDISEKLVLEEAARIHGRKSRRNLSKEQAQAMAEKRWGKKEEKIHD